MKNSKEVNAFLEKYFFTLSEKERTEFESKGFNVWNFGQDKELSDRLVNLVLKGRKRASASLYRTKDKVPEIGSHGIVLDSEDRPRCLIKYTSLAVKPFSQVDLEFAREEGEGSDDIRDWADEHRRFFEQENPLFSEASLVVCEKFKLVFKVI